MCGSQNNLCKFILSYNEGLRRWTQFIRLASKCLYLLRHLSSSTLNICSTCMIDWQVSSVFPPRIVQEVFRFPFLVGMVSYLENFFHIQFLCNLSMLIPHSCCLPTAATRLENCLHILSFLSLCHCSLFPQVFILPYSFPFDLSSLWLEIDLCWDSIWILHTLKGFYKQKWKIY